MSQADPSRRRAAAAGLLLACGLASCNDTRDLAPAGPSQPWTPVVRVGHDDAVPATGDRAAGARSIPTASRDFVLPPDPGLPYPDPHTALDPTHEYSLVELIDVAERNDKQTRIAWEEARQAAISVGLSQAAFLPEITLTALGGFRHETTPAEVPQGYVASDTVAAFPTLAISYLLVDFGARNAALRAARETSEAANVAFTSVHQQLILSVTRDYLSLETADAELDAARSEVDNANLLVNSAEAQYGHGEGVVTTVDDARSAAAQARYAVASAEASRQDARDGLLEVLGLPPRTPLRIVPLSASPVPRGMEGDLDRLIQDALRSRPDLLAALARLRATEADTAQARAALYPTIALDVKTGGDLGRIDVEGIASHSFDQPEAGIYLDFSWTLYSGGSKLNQIRLAQSREAEQAASLQQAEDQAMRQVALAYDELDTGLVQYDAAAAAQQAARTDFAADQDSFGHGEATITAAEAAATSLAQANATLARTHAQVLASAAALAFATGRLGAASSVPGIADATGGAGSAGGAGGAGAAGEPGGEPPELSPAP